MKPEIGLGTGPGTRGWDLYISSVVMVILAGFFVLARLIQRKLNKSLGLDDLLIVLSLISSIVLSITEIQAVVYGYGRRYKELTADQAQLARKWFYGAQIAYKVVLALNKSAICQMCFRIFRVSSRKFRLACHALQSLIVTSGVAFTVGTVFQCRPVAAFWDRSIEGASCIAQTPWWMSYATVQIVTDFMLLFLPISQVVRLQVSRVEKLGLGLVFSTGLFVTFTSIFRATTLGASATNPDPTYGPIPATTWSVIEANSGIIAACLPMLRQPFVFAFGQLTHTGRTRESSIDAPPARASRTFGNSRILQSKNNTIDITRHAGESEERIIGAGEIYVLHDVRVTSSRKQETGEQN